MKTKFHYNGPHNRGWQCNLIPDLIIQKAFNEWTINICWLFWCFSIDFILGKYNIDIYHNKK